MSCLDLWSSWGELPRSRELLAKVIHNSPGSIAEQPDQNRTETKQQNQNNQIQVWRRLHLFFEEA